MKSISRLLSAATLAVAAFVCAGTAHAQVQSPCISPDIRPMACKGGGCSTSYYVGQAGSTYLNTGQYILCCGHVVYDVA
jgi:hypothetical protein